MRAMWPLRISAGTAVTALGAGLAPLRAALRDRRGGLLPCAFPGAPPGIWIGAVPGLEAVAPAARSRRLRLPQQPPGRAGAAERRLRRGRGRRAREARGGAHRRGPRHQHRRHRADRAGLCRPRPGRDGPAGGFRLRPYPRPAGAAGLSAGPARAARAGAGGLHRLHLRRPGDDGSGGADRRRAGGCRGGGRGGQPLPPDAAWLQRAGTAEPRPLPALRRRPRRHLHRRGVPGWCCWNGPRTRRRGPLLLGAGASSDGHHMSSPHPEGLGAVDAMRAALAAAGLHPGGDRLREPARHRHPRQRRDGGQRHAPGLRRHRPLQLHQGLDRACARRLRRDRGAGRRALHRGGAGPRLPRHRRRRPGLPHRMWRPATAPGRCAGC